MSVSPNPTIKVTATTDQITLQIIEEINSLSVSKQPDNIVNVSSVGVQGVNGHSVLSGNGAPSDLIGYNLDLYINLSNGFLYRKTNGSWVFSMNLAPMQERIEITSQMFADKAFDLMVPPLNPDTVTMSFVGGGGAQTTGGEFIVSGTRVSWDGYTLDGFIEVGDILIMRY